MKRVGPGKIGSRHNAKRSREEKSRRNEKQISWNRRKINIHISYDCICFYCQVLLGSRRQFLHEARRGEGSHCHEGVISIATKELSYYVQQQTYGKYDFSLHSFNHPHQSLCQDCWIIKELRSCSSWTIVTGFQNKEENYDVYWAIVLWTLFLFCLW